MPADLSLTALEAKLYDRTDDAVVVLEDEDFSEYGVAMNQLISRRRHGRSPALD